MFDIHPDDVPVLTEKEKEMPDLVIYHRGWVFKFAYGYLWMSYPC